MTARMEELLELEEDAGGSVGIEALLDESADMPSDDDLEFFATLVSDLPEVA